MKIKKLRIAMLASNFIRIPPKPKYIPEGSSGAPEYIVHRITEELVKRGHRVTLFASGNSKTSAKLFSIYGKDSYTEERIGKENHRFFEHLLISQAYQLAKRGKFDIIHSHFDIRSCGYAPLVDTPTVSTLHSPLDGFLMDNILKFYKNTQYYTPISKAQKKAIKDLNYTDTVYHGIDLSRFKFNPHSKSHSVFIGRIVKEKGLDEAIKIVNRDKREFRFAGDVKDDYQNIFNRDILPYVDNKRIRDEGAIDHDDVAAFLGEAKSLLFPVKWEEPFGLVLIEAMACGTPVIAYARGAVPEVIKDGKTGFIINPSEKDKRGSWIVKKTGITGMIEAVRKIYSMPEDEYRNMREACRKHVENSFTVKKMIDGYEKVYDKVVADWKKKSKK